MIYGNKTLKVYSIDSEVINTYRIIYGYGLMFFTMSLVALFSIEKVGLNAKKAEDKDGKKIV